MDRVRSRALRSHLQKKPRSQRPGNGKLTNIALHCEALEIADAIIEELELRSHRTSDEQQRLRHALVRVGCPLFSLMTTLPKTCLAMAENLVAKLQLPLSGVPTPTTRQGAMIMNGFIWVCGILLTTFAYPWLKKAWQKQQFSPWTHPNG